MASATAGELVPPGAHVHIVAVGGVMMSAIAHLLRAQGCSVSGSDLQASGLTQALEREGVTVHIGPQQAGNVPPETVLVAISSAVPADNPEVIEAKRRGLPVLKRDAVLGQVVNARRGVAVAGTHGKTTTSGLIAVVLTEAGLDPTFLVGSVVQNYGSNCGVGGGELLVVEADEYDRAFLTLEPEVAVVTNVENDHPDIYADFDDYLATFHQFVSQVRPEGRLILCADCPITPSLASSARCPVWTYGRAAEADWRVVDDPRAPFAIVTPDGQTLLVPSPMVGAHNQLNATAAVAAAAACGVEASRAADLVARFAGTERRMQVLAAHGGIRVLDDYAHHPTEVRATIAAARALGGRLRVVFEPHQFARTRALLQDYVGAFDEADEALICDIYAARDHGQTGVTAEQLAEVAGHAVYVGTYDRAMERLTATAGDDETWLVMGAGSVTALAHDLAAWVAARTP